MDRNTFGRLCGLLRQLGGLEDGKYVSVEEQMALFLGVLGHHKKNRIVGFDYWRSGQTISQYLHKVLNAVLVLHGILLVKLEPVSNDCNDQRWKWFKGCLGALDGTYINVKVPNVDKPSWEGSAGDSRILRDAITRVYGLKVPKGNYYLCDNGYANSDGFLTPYRGIHYHLKEWGPENSQPQNAEGMFNMRHSKARNVIERAFGIMKMRWGILRSAAYYPIKIQIRIIHACFLLHNFIRSVMEVDPLEEIVDAELMAENHELEDPEVEYIDGVESSPVWNQKRAAIATEMWQNRQ